MHVPRMYEHCQVWERRGLLTRHYVLLLTLLFWPLYVMWVKNVSKVWNFIRITVINTYMLYNLVCMVAKVRCLFRQKISKVRPNSTYRFFLYSDLTLTKKMDESHRGPRMSSTRGGAPSHPGSSHWCGSQSVFRGNVGQTWDAAVPLRPFRVLGRGWCPDPQIYEGGGSLRPPDRRWAVCPRIFSYYHGCHAGYRRYNNEYLALNTI